MLELKEKIQEKVKINAYYFYLQTKGGTITYKGSSMFPVLKDGWKIRVEPKNLEGISKGDILVFVYNSGLTVHRTIGKFKKGKRIFFLQKGDVVNFGGIIKAEQVIGRVVEVLDPPVGKIDNGLWKKQNSIFITCSLVFCFIYVLLSYLKRGILGSKKNYITNWLYQIYWKLSFLILSILSAKYRLNDLCHRDS